MDTILSGVMALVAIALLAQVLLSYLRHANAEVVLTDRRALWREAGRTRQTPWEAVKVAEHHPRALILCTSMPYEDEVRGKIAEAFVVPADPNRLVCPLADPPRVWADLLAQGVVAHDLVERPEGEPAPVGRALAWLALGLLLLSSGLFVLVELRVRLGVWGLLLGLALLGLGLACLVSPIRRAHEAWIEPEDPDAKA